MLGVYNRHRMNRLRFCFAYSSVAVLVGVASAAPTEASVSKLVFPSSFGATALKSPYRVTNDERLIFLCIRVVSGPGYSKDRAKTPAPAPILDLTTPYADRSAYQSIWLNGYPAKMKNPFGKHGARDEKRIAQIHRIEIAIPEATRISASERIRHRFTEGLDANSTEAVPEPTTLLVLGAGALLLKRRRK